MWQLYTILLYKSFHTYLFTSKECCSFAKSWLTLCDPMDCNTPGSSVLHYLLEFTEISEKKTFCWCSYTSLVTMTLFSHIIVNLLSPIPCLCLFPIFLCGYFFTLISKSSLPSKDCEILSFGCSIFPQFFIFLVYANHFFLFWFRNCIFYLFQVDSFSSVTDVYACQAAHDYKNIYPCFILGLSWSLFFTFFVVSIVFVNHLFIKRDYSLAQIFIVS